MDKKVIIFGFLVIAVLSFVVRNIFTEEKEILDVDWSDPYEITSKKGNGLWVFEESIRKMYDDVTISKNRPADSINDPHIQIYVHDKLHFSHSEATEILDRVDLGMMVYVIARNIEFGDYEEGQVCCYYGGETTINQVVIDDHYYVVEIKTSEVERPFMKNRVEGLLVDYQLTSKIEYLNSEIKDSITLVDPYYLDACFVVGNGTICFNNAPELITNFNSLQPHFIPYINHLFGDKPYETVEIINKYQGSNVEHQGFLGKILNHRSLKWAYYLLLSLLLIYVYFGGKRKQRAIPIIPKKRNTILEYVDVVSSLYLSHKDPDKLSKKMQENFHFYMYERYNLKHTDEHYYTQLQRRLTSEPELLDKARDLFSSSNYDDKKIELLYRTLDKLYKNAR